MAGLLLAPNPLNDTTSGVPWAASYSGPRTTTRTVGTAGNPTSQSETDRWDEYVSYLQQALQQSAGFERWKIEQQLADAEAGRSNAYKIAQLQAKTSRYGTDRQTEVELARLKETQRQFDANHALEQQKFGLSVADAYTRYSQTPDMVWALNDFKGALNRVGLGQGPQPISSNPVQPKPKTWEDFAALSGYNLPAVSAGQTTPSMGQGTGAAGVGGTPDIAVPGGGTTTAIEGGGTGTDPRIKAMRAVADAIPPSDTPGNDQQDWAALNAIRNLYFAGRPGDVERLGAARRKTAQAGLARLQYDPSLVEEDRQRSLPGQTSVRSY